jgi:hypothetical protein
MGALCGACTGIVCWSRRHCRAGEAGLVQLTLAKGAWLAA